MGVEIKRVPTDFRDWDVLERLLHAAFAYQNGRIDPPSSAHALDAKSIARKGKDEHLFLAFDEAELVGCVFAAPRAGALYVNKLAVWPHRQREGIGRRLMQAAEQLARESSLATLELDTRIELVENHRTFEALGFVKTAEGAHDGFARPTFITMRRPLRP